MALSIIGAGFGRTGTHSLKCAIERLGFGPCHHMYEVRCSAEQISRWAKIAAGGEPDWDLLFEGFRSQVDWPGARYWKELACHYPEAKVILTVRDPDAWYASISRTILPAAEIGRHADPDASGRAGSDIIYRIALEGIFGGRLDDRSHALETFERHCAEVKATIPAERLLVFDVGQGWGPLCAFLGVEQPATQFPRCNSVEEFRARKTYLSDGSQPRKRT